MIYRHTVDFRIVDGGNGALRIIAPIEALVAMVESIDVNKQQPPGHMVALYATGRIMMTGIEPMEKSE